MPSPEKPVIDYSYTGFQASLGDGSFPGTQLDADLAELVTSIDETIDALADVRRSDGALKNGIVTQDALSSDFDASSAAVFVSQGAAAAAEASAAAAALSASLITGVLTTPQAFGAVADGLDGSAAVNTTAFNNFVAYLSANHLPGFIPDGDYKVSGAIALASNVKLTGSRSARLVMTSGHTGHCLAGSGVTNVVLDGFSVVGNYVGVGGNQNNIQFANSCADIVVRNMSSINAIGEGIYITVSNNRVLIENNYVSNCQNNIVVFKGNTYVDVRQNYVNAARLNGIMVDDATVVDTIGTAVPNVHVTVDDNDVVNAAAVAIGHGISVSSSLDIIVSNNRVNGVGVSGSISGTGIIINSGQAFYSAAQHVLVAGNEVSGCKGNSGIYIAGVRGFEVVNNICYDNGQWNSLLVALPEIAVVDDNAGTGFHNSKGYIAGNNIYKTGGSPTSYTDIGIWVNTGSTDIAVGPNKVTGLTTISRNESGAGNVHWSWVTGGALPTWINAGDAGKMHGDAAGTPWWATTTAWAKLRVYGAPVTKTGDFTVAELEGDIIVNKGSTCTVTLPAAASFAGREIYLVTIQAFTVVSNASNVVPIAGGAAGTAILAATAGKFARLVSDGTNWKIMASN